MYFGPQQIEFRPPTSNLHIIQALRLMLILLYYNPYLWGAKRDFTVF